MEPTLRGYAEEGFDLVICHGFEYSQLASDIAPDYPDTYFYVSAKTPGDIEIAPNLQYVDQLEFEGSFLCGVLAGLMTETNVVGHVGGMEIPPQVANLAAYTLGAEMINPDVKVLGIITGTFVDAEKGREAALSLIGLDVDVLYQTADTTGVGAMAAAVDAGIYIIGYAGDMRDVAPDLVLTSNLVDIKRLIAWQVDRIEEGVFGGTVLRAGLASRVIDLAPFGSMVPQCIQDQIMLLRTALTDGYLMAPEIYERLDR